VYLEIGPDTEDSGIARYATMFPKERLVPCGPGAWWAVMPGDGVTMVYWVFEAPRCNELSMHRHDESQSGYVLEGELALRYEDGSERTLRAGEFYAIPPGVLHGATIRRRAVVMDVYAPARKDYEERYMFAQRAKENSTRRARLATTIK
jgi:quercetin dioxygenase-like cupin family protein